MFRRFYLPWVIAVNYSRGMKRKNVCPKAWKMCFAGPSKLSGREIEDALGIAILLWRTPCILTW